MYLYVSGCFIIRDCYHMIDIWILKYLGIVTYVSIFFLFYLSVPIYVPHYANAFIFFRSLIRRKISIRNANCYCLWYLLLPAYQSVFIPQWRAFRDGGKFWWRPCKDDDIQQGCSLSADALWSASSRRLYIELLVSQICFHFLFSKMIFVSFFYKLMIL